jgi:hypothetical protein
MKTSVFILAFLLLSLQSIGQQTDTTGVNKKRLSFFVIGSTVAYTTTLVGLNQLWYSQSEKQDFAWFNDNSEWKQVDKIGHFFSSYYFSYGTSQALKWTGVAPKKSDWIGALTGFAIMLPIEIMDGYSADYGASSGDLLANALGAGFYYGQTLLWNEQRIYPKFSFHTTNYAALRPEVLGENVISQLFKDYNGQTYWLSVDMDKFLRFPKWLNIAVGYGAEAMVYANDASNEANGYHAYRQFYVGLDFDLTAIKTRSKALKTLLFFANMIKIPAPTVEFSSEGTRFHILYF